MVYPFYDINLAIYYNNVKTPLHINVCRVKSKVSPIMTKSFIMNKLRGFEHFFGKNNRSFKTAVQENIIDDEPKFYLEQYGPLNPIKPGSCIRINSYNNNCVNLQDITESIVEHISGFDDYIEIDTTLTMGRIQPVTPHIDLKHNTNPAFCCNGPTLLVSYLLQII